MGAWWVVIYHLKDELALLLSKDSLLIHFINAGHIGVTLFFILSGFILTYNYANTFNSLSLSNYLHFLGQRLARIYPVHIFTLVSLLLLIVTANVAGYSLGSPERYTAGKFFEHLFLVNGWSLPINTSWNGVAWTLSVEWLCYLLFPQKANVRLFGLLRLNAQQEMNTFAAFAAVTGLLGKWKC